VVGRARLGKLAGYAPNLHHGLRTRIGQDDSHLQEDAEEIADIVGPMLGKALGAITPLQQERLAIGDGGEMLLELARLACKDQRRIGRHTAFNFGEHCRVRISRNLLNWLVPPGVWRPFHHNFHPKIYVGSSHGRGSLHDPRNIYQFLSLRDDCSAKCDPGDATPAHHSSRDRSAGTWSQAPPLPTDGLPWCGRNRPW